MKTKKKSIQTGKENSSRFESEMEAMKKTKTERWQDMENLGK